MDHILSSPAGRATGSRLVSELSSQPSRLPGPLCASRGGQTPVGLRGAWSQLQGAACQPCGGKEELSLSIARRGWHPSAQAWMLSCVRCFASGVMTMPKSLLLVPRATLP